MRKHTAMKCSCYLSSYLQQASTQKVALEKCHPSGCFHPVFPSSYRTTYKNDERQENTECTEFLQNFILQSMKKEIE